MSSARSHPMDRSGGELVLLGRQSSKSTVDEVNVLLVDGYGYGEDVDRGLQLQAVSSRELSHPGEKFNFSRLGHWLLSISVDADLCTSLYDEVGLR